MNSKLVVRTRTLPTVSTNTGSQVRRLRFRKKRNGGFLLLDALIAAAVVFSGLGVLVNLMPQLLAMSVRQNASSDVNNYALAKQQEILSGTYINVVAGGNQTGTFTTLLGAGATDVGKYSWVYVASETDNKVMKKVNLAVYYQNGSVNVNTDTWIFYVADLADEVP